MKSSKKMFFSILIVILNIQFISASSNSAFDHDLYESVLDSELCARQLEYIRNNNTFLRAQFMDASWRLPRSILQGNTRDLGNYFPCLGIREDVMDIGGKYCAVGFPLELDNIQLPTFSNNDTKRSEPMLKLPWDELNLDSDGIEELKAILSKNEKARYALRVMLGDNPDYHSAISRTIITIFIGRTLELAVCIPKACTSRQALDFYTYNVTSVINVTERYCRLPNDKRWVPVDTLAVVIFSCIGLLIIISTAYDIRHTIYLERDPKSANQLYKSFSVYSNTRDFFVFPSGPNVVTCLDGVRSLAMMWVIVGHTFVTQLVVAPENVLDMFNFMLEFSSLWIMSATITVDTFFLLTGILLVYTTAAKVTSMDLIKNLHLFYLNRLLRMFPVLAACILMTASFMHRLVDGPDFRSVSQWVENCRTNWWSTLLYVQNFLHPGSSCLQHSWYLAIDMHFHIFSPLVLFWVLGQNRRTSWLALIAALIAILTGTSVYNFINDFQSNSIAQSRNEGNRYMHNYYFHSLPRSTPFFVGMIYGYILHLYRGKKVKIPMVLVILLWIFALSGTSFVCSIHYWNVQPDWDNQLLDNLINSYMRPFWAACVGWLIFACHKGYGGPINWILSLQIFKILGRLSYAMYIFHYPLMYLLHSTILTTLYYTIHHSMFQFIVDYTIAVIAAFLVTILIDMPFTNLIKMALEDKKKKLSPVQRTVVKEDPELDVKPNDNGNKTD